MSRVIIIDVTKTWTHTLQSTVEALQDYLQRQAMDTSAIWVVSEAQKTLVRPRATDQVRVIGAGNDYSAILQAPSAVAEVVTEQTADAKVTRVDVFSFNTAVFRAVRYLGQQPFALETIHINLVLGVPQAPRGPSSARTPSWSWDHVVSEREAMDLMLDVLRNAGRYGVRQSELRPRMSYLDRRLSGGNIATGTQGMIGALVQSACARGLVEVDGMPPNPLVRLASQSQTEPSERGVPPMDMAGWYRPPFPSRAPHATAAHSVAMDISPAQARSVEVASPNAAEHQQVPLRLEGVDAPAPELSPALVAPEPAEAVGAHLGDGSDSADPPPLLSLCDFCQTSNASDIAKAFARATRDAGIGADPETRYATNLALGEWANQAPSPHDDFGELMRAVKPSAWEKWNTTRSELALAKVIRPEHFHAGFENTLRLHRRTQSLLRPDGRAVSANQMFGDAEPVGGLAGDFAVRGDAELLYSWLGGQLVQLSESDYGLLARVLYPEYVRTERRGYVVAALQELERTGRATLSDDGASLLIH